MAGTVISVSIAALDEIRHARRCFAFAHTYGRTAVGPGPIAELANARIGPSDPTTLALTALADGYPVARRRLTATRLGGGSCSDTTDPCRGPPPYVGTNGMSRSVPVVITPGGNVGLS
jgi:hypothetical protein